MANSPFVFDFPSERVTPTWSISSENGTYPATNVGNWTDAYIPKPGLSTSTTGVLTGSLSARVDGLLIQHNYDAGLTLRVVTTTSSTTRTVPAKRKNGYTTIEYIDLTALSGYTTSAITSIVIDATTANSVAVGWKVLCIGRKRQLTRNVKFGWRNQRINLGISHATSFGATWDYTFPAGARVLVGTVEPADTSLVDLVDWFEDADGVVTAMAAIDPLLPNEGHLVKLRSSGSSGLLQANGPRTTTLDVQRRPGGFLNYNPVQITAEEVSPGAPEWA
jgi:hypothetical protein